MGDAKGSLFLISMLNSQTVIDS